MTPYNSVVPTAAPGTVYGSPVTLTDSQAPAGTLAPGTKIQVGSQKVVIQKYFSEGGFAHVYLVKMQKPIDGTDIAILKRVAVPDKENLASMRTEVETMKKLKGHRPIVTYYDSHASQLKGGGYEVFLLMEFCNGGGLIEYMNTRLQNRLTEPEILNIFSDVAEGVACMHYLKPPLLHRDLKVENVLITTKSGIRRFKLCDFGSTAPPRSAASTVAECRLIEEDVQKHTTLQYRSPEMVDVYRKVSIDEKSDIWALGVLLYKLCFYTTPFEAQGQLAILNASFKFPTYPQFSNKLKLLIVSMLNEKPQLRPNIYQVLREVCLLQGTQVPIKDIYHEGNQSTSLQNKELPSKDCTPTSAVGAVFSPICPNQTIIPEVIPMRRGRPTIGQAPKRNLQQIQVASNDPWAALDSSSQQTIEDASVRFPSLDQFSLLLKGGKFDFDKNSSESSDELNSKSTKKLAEDAFASHKELPESIVQDMISSNPNLQDASTSMIFQSVPIPTPLPAPNRSYISQGTMTSSSPPVSNTISVSLNQESVEPFSPVARTPPPKNMQMGQKTPNSNPSPENIRPPSSGYTSLTKSSKNSRLRPTGTFLESNIEFLREKEINIRSNSQLPPHLQPGISDSSSSSSDADEMTEKLVTQSGIYLLRQSEMDQNDKGIRRYSSGSKNKRNSLTSLVGTKTLLAGKFGDAFKRFEHNASHHLNSVGQALISNSLNVIDHERRDLSAGDGSDVVLEEVSGYGNMREESELDIDTEKKPAEQRREAERRRLSLEEKRVSEAGAEYRKRVGDIERQSSSSLCNRPGGISRVASIQRKVQNLLDESRGKKSDSPQSTASGYGRLSDTRCTSSSTGSGNPYATVISPVSALQIKSDNIGCKQQQTLKKDGSNIAAFPDQSQSIIAPISKSSTFSKSSGAPRPSAPPKPYHLNHMINGAQGALKAYVHHPSLAAKNSLGGLKNIETRIGVSGGGKDKEELVGDFSQRFPGLGGIQMVEREIKARNDKNFVKKK